MTASPACLECAIPLTGRQQRFCSRRCNSRHYMREARASGKEWALNPPRDKRLVDLTCSNCDCTYRGHQPNKDDEHRFTYCSTECEGAAKAERYADICVHGVKAQWCSTCSFMGRVGGRVGWHDVLRADPCAYCGGDAAGIDHITATHNGGGNGSENLTGCCWSCNARKHTLDAVPFLLHERLRGEIEPIEAQRLLISARVPGGDPSRVL